MSINTYNKEEQNIELMFGTHQQKLTGGILLMENTFFEINLAGVTQENSLDTLNDFSSGLLEGATVILQTRDGRTISLNTDEVQASFEPYEEE